jgi:site-specific recombinase XerC
MQELIEQFIREKRFLKKVTPKTITFYRQSLRALTKIIGEVGPSHLSRSLLSQVVVKMREGGLSARSCNTYISGINSFLTWPHENGHTVEHLKIKEQRGEHNLPPSKAIRPHHTSYDAPVCRVQPEDLKEAHDKVSLLNRIK